MALMVNPPKEGSESYEQYKQEESSVMDSLRRRAQIMTDGFNACEGVSCTFTEGAMYSFPRLDLPQKASHGAPILAPPSFTSSRSAVHFTVARPDCWYHWALIDEDNKSDRVTDLLQLQLCRPLLQSWAYLTVEDTSSQCS